MSVSLPIPPVLYSADPMTWESVGRLAAAADVEVTVHDRWAEGRAEWNRAPLILIGADMLAEIAQARLPRRDHVVVVCRDDRDVWRDAVTVGVEQVLVLPESDRALIDVLVDAGLVRSPRAPVLCVLGGCGGAGASTLAVALALAARRIPGGVLLIDGDSLGGGVDLALHGEHVPGVRWRDLSATRGRVSPEALRQALPVLDGVHVLSHDRRSVTVDASAWEAMLAAGAGAVGLVVVDLAVGVADAPLAAARWTLMVVPADLRSVAAAAARLDQVRRVAGEVSVVVRRRRDSDLDPDDVARALGAPVWGSVSDARASSRDRLAESVLVHLGCVGQRRRRRRAA